MSMFNPPSAPSPQTGMVYGAQVAEGQQGYNNQAGIDSQAGSMVNQYNPYGSLTYTQTGTGPNGIPLYSANLQLSPTQQALFDALQGTKGSAASAARSLMQNANYGSTDPGTTIGDFTQGLTRDYMNTQTSYYQPFFTTQRNQLDTQLRNQGLHPGDPAYDNAMRGLDTSQNLAVTKAAGDFEPQAYSQAVSRYTLPGQLAENLASFGAPGDPNSDLVQTPGLNIQPANLIGAVGTEQGALNDQYKAQMAQYQAMMSGLFGIGSAALGGWAKGGFPMPSFGAGGMGAEDAGLA